MQTLRRILIVEDEEGFADNLRVFLERNGYEVVVAHDGLDAVAVADRFAPDLVLLDYNMGDMNGLETIEALRRKLPPFGCIMMSGHLGDDVMLLVFRHGIRHVLNKPFGLADLRRLLALPLQELVLEEALTSPLPPGPSRRTFPERRRISQLFSLPLRLADGTWLLADRRKSDRRAQAAGPASVLPPITRH
jgi:CheY-like chemotaxis protein